VLNEINAGPQIMMLYSSSVIVLLAVISSVVCIVLYQFQLLVYRVLSAVVGVLVLCWFFLNS